MQGAQSSSLPFSISRSPRPKQRPVFDGAFKGKRLANRT